MYQAALDFLSQNILIPAVLLGDSAEVPINNYFVRYEKKQIGYVLQLKDYTNKNNPTTVKEITGVQFKAFFDALEEIFVANHRNIKSNEDWRTFYGYFKDFFDFYDDKNEKINSREEEGVYCRQCGLVLHHTQVQVDHFKPRVGGLGAAILKVFRAFGLTLHGPTGLKGVGGRTKYAARLGGNTATAAKFVGDSVTKYRMNEAGTIYFSAIKAAGHVDALAKMCMNSYFNLRPVCGSCNAAKGNRMWED